MEFQDFNPYLRYIDKVKLHDSYPQFLRAYDFRLFYVIKGYISVEFENQKFSLYEKDLIIFPPGISYKLSLDEKNNKTTYYVLNFDFDDLAQKQKARTPVPVKQFNPTEIFSTTFIEPFNNVFLLKNATFAESVLDDIDGIALKQTLQNKYITALFKYLLVKCIIINDSKNETLTLPQTIIQKTKEYIHKNISNRPTNQSIAKAIGYHPYYLNSLFVKHEHITLHKYINNICLKKAKELLLNTNLPISDIAEQSGFSEGNYFSRIFKKYVGLTPTQYREFSR